jgi:hypothetical protein
MSEIAAITDVKRLEEIILSAPQVDLMTTHHLEGGMYARTIYLEAGTVLTGAIHKTDHLNIVFGDISVTTDEGMQRITGYRVIETKAGMKRAGYAHAATAWTTICKTDKTVLSEIEDDLVEEADKLQTRHPQLTANQPLTLKE